MPAFLINDQGDCVAATVSFAKRLGSPMHGQDLEDFLVRNVGYVHVVIGTTSHIRLRPDRVSPLALSAGLAFLFRDAGKKVSVDWFADGWQRRTFPQPAEAVQHVVELCHAAEITRRAPNLLSRAIPRRYLSVGHPLHAVLDAWASGERSVESLLAIERGPQGRYFVIDTAPQGGPVILQGGVSLVGKEPAWREDGPTLRVLDWPDGSYGRWAAQAYLQAACAAHPQIDAVDCCVVWPRVGTRRHTYHRLIVPCENSSGQPLLLAVMVDSNDISLRGQLH